MKHIYLIALSMLMITIFASQSFSSETNLFNTDFLHETEKYYEVTHINEAIYQSQTIITRENSNITITSHEGSDRRIVEIRNDLTPLRAILEHDSKVVAEIVYNTNEIIMKDKGEIFKTIRKKPGQTYYQRESLELLLRGYKFERGETLNFHLLSLDLDCYFMELTLVGKEKLRTKMGDLTCYKLLVMPGGAGKIFAAKYKNYYYFTEERPHYYIKYYNDFIPLVTEVEAPNLVNLKLREY